ncbi:MAG: SulP family inorganic anion transporter, partial [Wenzhouxiangella sp.]|nr:SulP family inorganic anion transporter [Wenzhouxiangella sp.]
MTAGRRKHVLLAFYRAMWRQIFSRFRKSGLHPFPLLDTLRTYTWRKAIADIRAGTNVALLDFPQGMAYALIAGLPVQMGLFCSALSSITGPLTASSRFVMLGPTNATAVMLLST